MDDIIEQMDELIEQMREAVGEAPMPEPAQQNTVGPQAPREVEREKHQGEGGGAVGEGGVPVSSRLFDDEGVRDDEG